jgi:hypothetical protein
MEMKKESGCDMLTKTSGYPDDKSSTAEKDLLCCFCVQLWLNSLEDGTCSVYL